MRQPNQDEPTLFSSLVMTDQELIEAEFEPINWLVPNTIPNPGLIALSGRPGHYKTFFAMWISKRLSAGLPLFDQFEEHPDENMGLLTSPNMQTKCLFIEQEMNRRQIKTRTMAMKNFEGSSVYWVIGGNVNVFEDRWIKGIQHFISTHQIKLLILDPFTSVSRMKDENSNSEARHIMDIIRSSFIDNKLECTVIFLHHPSKGDDSGSGLRGAGDILGKCDVHLALEKMNAKERIVQVRYEKNRDVDDAIVSNFEMQLRNDTADKKLEWVFLRHISQDKKADDEKIKAKIIELMMTKDMWMRNEIADAVNLVSNSTLFTRIWKHLQNDGLMIKQGGKFMLANQKLINDSSSL